MYGCAVVKPAPDLIAIIFVALGEKIFKEEYKKSTHYDLK